jgi:tRNA threonylcarbamoyl adenosine modification protein YeaZ
VTTLTLDTATSIASVGLVLADGRSLSAEPIRATNAAQHVLSAVDAVLGEAEIDVRDISSIAVGRGPGSFTGLRIGLATALGLSEALGVPVIGVDTLGVLQHAGSAGAIAVIDARRGEVFAEGAGVPAASYTPEQLATQLERGAVLVGDGALRYRELFAESGCSVPADDSPLHWPNPTTMVEQAQSDPQPATALYLRAPDAVPEAAR